MQACTQHKEAFYRNADMRQQDDAGYKLLSFIMIIFSSWHLWCSPTTTNKKASMQKALSRYAMPQTRVPEPGPAG